MDELKSHIRHVPDFPKPGILFYDVTTLLKDRVGFQQAIEAVGAPFKGDAVDVVAGIESRGFIFGSALADRLGAGFVPVRKPGKLPAATVSASYALEYGTDRLEVHADALEGRRRVLVVDDLLATGGTARAAVDLMRSLGGDVVGVAFLIELSALDGRAKLAGERVHAALRY